MLQRVLARENVGERRRALFRASGITTQRQLLQRPLWDVAHAVDLSVRETEVCASGNSTRSKLYHNHGWLWQELLTKLSIRLAPASRSAFDLFLESANHPTFLRTGLTSIDQALNGGLHCRALSEFVGTAGIGKSQVAMTLAVVCAMDYPDNGVMFFDVEHNFSAKRLLQIAMTRIKLTHAGQEADINELAATVIKRIRVMRVNSIAAFTAKLKEMEDAMHSLRINLIIIDCVTTLFQKADDLTHAQRQHQMLRMARNLKLFADTYQAFVVVTNRATTVEGEGGLYTNPQLGDSWAHCVTTRFIMERHSLYRAMVIAKSSAAGYVVQPFTVKEGGVEPLKDEQSSRQEDSDEFAIHNDLLLSDLAMAALPMVDPACTLRSTQQSSAEDPDATQLVGQSDDEESQLRQQEEAQETATSSFDIVSDSNSEEEDESFDWDVVTEE
ncbi:DNA repair protein RAD51 [Phytophthora pseudosyringae]|uniref:DNA repair protein RAD51 n=1 Tax=Phytophthora pseudosyringae TaxID=221518 RepID=A0A8T1WCK1_9STRA|nr:DNA repair protein RAD51 [Phytophthora pseudosyringae]